MPTNSFSRQARNLPALEKCALLNKHSVRVRRGQKKAFCRSLSAFALAAACLAANAFAMEPRSESFAAPESMTISEEAVSEPNAATLLRPLSREHVNLVKVRGDKITDVVFDAQALEVSADKERGIVFVQVKPRWLASHPGQAVTSAFFNTQTENHAVRFVAADVASQTIELHAKTDTRAQGAAQALRSLQEAFAAPLTPLASEDFVSRLKEVVKSAAAGAPAGGEPAAVGLAFSQEGSSLQLVELPQPAKASIEGFSVRQTRVWVGTDFVCEELHMANMNIQRKTIDLGSLAQSIPGVVALAAQVLELDPGMTSTVYVIRARADMQKRLALGSAQRIASDDEEAPAVFAYQSLGAADGF